MPPDMRRASWWRGGEEGEQHPPARAASTAAADLGGERRGEGTGRRGEVEGEDGTRRQVGGGSGRGREARAREHWCVACYFYCAETRVGEEGGGRKRGGKYTRHRGPWRGRLFVSQRASEQLGPPDSGTERSSQPTLCTPRRTARRVRGRPASLSAPHEATTRRDGGRHGVFPFPFTLSSTTRRSPSLSVSSGSDRAFPPRRLTGTGRPAGSPVPGVRPPPFRASLTSTRQ